METTIYSVLLNFTVYGKLWSLQEYNFIQNPYFTGTRKQCESFIKKQRIGAL